MGKRDVTPEQMQEALITREVVNFYLQWQEARLRCFYCGHDVNEEGWCRTCGEG